MFGHGGGEKEVAPSSRREAPSSSSRRYRVEIPTSDDDEKEKDRYTPSTRSNASTRRTRSDLPRRSHTKRDDNMVGDVGAPNKSKQVAHASSKKSKRHSIDLDEEVGIVHDVKKTQPTSPRRQSDRRTTVQQERERLASTKQDHGDGSKKNTSFSSSATDEPRTDRKSTNTKNRSSTAATTNDKSSTKTASKLAVAELVDDDEPLVPKRHCIWMPFGHARTWSGVLLMSIGITLSILARRSTSFVKLNTPLQLSPHIAPITDVGDRKSVV